MKETLKNIKIVVKLYEIIFSRIHQIKEKINYIKEALAEKNHFSYGELNPKKKFYVIQYDHENCGIFSMIFHILPHIEYAVRKHYIPIIDCREYLLPLIQNDGDCGRKNAWEYYFEQPLTQYSLDEVYRSKHVIFPRKKTIGIRQAVNYIDLKSPENVLNSWGKVYRKYIRLNEPLQKRLDQEKKRILEGNKLLGVYIRAEYRWGGEAKNPLYYGHPKIKTCEEYIADVERIMEQWNYDSFFLCVDDREYLDKMIGYFGKKCKVMERARLTLFRENILVPIEDICDEFINCSIKSKNEDYLIELYVLAQCDSLYTTLGTGAGAACLINNGKYKNVKVCDSGRWSKEELGII